MFEEYCEVVLFDGNLMMSKPPIVWAALDLRIALLWSDSKLDFA